MVRLEHRTKMEVVKRFPKENTLRSLQRLGRPRSKIALVILLSLDSIFSDHMINFFVLKKPYLKILIVTGKTWYFSIQTS